MSSLTSLCWTNLINFSYGENKSFEARGKNRNAILGIPIKVKWRIEPSLQSNGGSVYVDKTLFSSKK